MTTPLHHNTKLSFLLFAFSFLIFNNAKAKASDVIIASKANFILEIAYNVYYSEPSGSKTYEIGIYGRDSESKAVFSKLSHMTQGMTIDDKPISIKLFKNMRSVLPVDVIYISGNTKIRLGDLHNKLSDNSYSMITENYPFGSSSINFSFDKNDELIFEIQESTLRSNGATLRRKILKNRQRIASAQQWQSAVEGGDDAWSIPVAKDSENNTVALDSAEAEIFLDENSQPINSVNRRCAEQIKTAVKKANNRTKWVSIIALLTIGGLGYYIFKLKKNKG